MNKPQIRFKGFDEEWEQSTFGEICSVYDGVHQTPHYRSSGVMFVSVENIKTLTSQKFISFEDYQRDYKIAPEKGDILMTRIGDIGTANIVSSDSPLAYYVSLALLKNPKLDSYFFKTAIGAQDTKAELWKRTLHIAFPKKINKNEISYVGVKFPTLTEQQQIGNYFKGIDEMITEVEREITRLEKMKQASLQKMFPRPGQSTPEIRFAGFIDEWKTKTLGEIAEIYQPQTISQSELTTDGFPVYGANGLIGYYSEYNHEFPQIAITCRGNTCGTINFTPPKTWITGNAMVVNVDNTNINKEFIYFFLQGRDMNNLISGSGQPQITRKPIAEFAILLPDNEEQQALGEYFRNLDTLLNSKRQKLVKLRNIKQACLDKMFVNTSDNSNNSYNSNNSNS